MGEVSHVAWSGALLPAKLMRALPTPVADVVPARSDDRSSSNLNPEVDVLIP
jgi:hypothetical protein